jgi:hypothetical protein
LGRASFVGGGGSGSDQQDSQFALYIQHGPILEPGAMATSKYCTVSSPPFISLPPGATAESAMTMAMTMSIIVLCMLHTS